MKKTTLTTAIVLGLATTMFADNYNHEGGLFNRGLEPREYASRDEIYAPLMLPQQHGMCDNQGAEAPIGSGIAVLIGFGGAYLMDKRRKEK